MNANFEAMKAVSVTALQQFGCPSCGSKNGSSECFDGRTMLWMCRDCGAGCCGLMQGITRATFAMGDFYAKLQVHPFQDISDHRLVDKRPEDGGEFFRPFKYGLAYIACFVCGAYVMDGNGSPWLNEMSARVRSWEASGRVIEMFRLGPFQRSAALLNEGARKLGRIEVDIGACDEHYCNLIKLHDLTQIGVITKEYLKEARG
jgi:hypothetical protein